MSNTVTKNVVDLAEGDVIDVPPEWVVGTDNEVCAQFEYAVVECVNDGWADDLAGPDEVVIYVPNYAMPIMAPAGATVDVVDSGQCSLCAKPPKEQP